MTDVVVADATTETVAVNEVPTYADSNGDALGVDSLVRISIDQATEKWDYETDTYRAARDFDFGIVNVLNEDGTVQVSWDAAGCRCGENENGRTESTSDLTLTTDAEETIYVLGYEKGLDEGSKGAQARVRLALGLPYEIPSSDDE